MEQTAEKPVEQAVAPREAPSNAALAGETNPVVSMVDMIERVAANPDVDPDKLEKIIALQERILDREAEQAYAASMTAAQAEMAAHPVVKDAWNDQTRSPYAKLGAINKAITPIYTQHGFSLSFGTEPPLIEGCVRVTCEIRHRLGYRKTEAMDMPLDNAGIKGTVNKTGPHAVGSSTSYARRYLTCLIFNLVVLDEDNDGNHTPDPNYIGNTPLRLNPEQASQLRKGLKLAGMTEAEFCKKAGINQIDELYAERFKGAMQMLKNRADKRRSAQ